MNQREQFFSATAKPRRWVVKIGSSLLTDNGRTLDVPAINGWVTQMAQLRQQGIEVVLVSSGAVAAGMSQLGWKERPDRIHELQAAAAVGQMGLVQTYQQAFHRYQLHAAQILLDHDDMSNRTRYLNARSTLKTLLSLGVIPVVNENDTVVTDEIRFGDNDTLAALVTNLVEAELLVILTDQPGMYNDDPRSNPEATLINEISSQSPELDRMAGDGGRLGRGGMITKVRAARLAARSGAHSIIVGGKLDNVLGRLLEGESLGTLMVADQQPQQARKHWLAGQLQMRGTLTLDAGAVSVLRDKGTSLLAVGVRECHGDFHRGDMVVCIDTNGDEVARGLVNYSAEEVRLIQGASTESIRERLGYKDQDELIHRDNLVLV
ncbi:glutamate 5-kinase [Marinibactrum halimedae]|uniref:Glutamate 5-kinase n=1 Tax=Marinibactrum halimedae TaxID=1444977 RepID=A0AA37T3K8_9GAMM|nr:glutamate 5-kinase [Marinibactrum halimedae]MCD9457800.1 glutamate 5-kinase [Marinibactrum halimedae]GLS24826.1 glutamate 5-kinase [Marinibactrum halimedae]